MSDAAPSIRSPNLGIRTLTIDVDPATEQAHALDRSDEVSFWGMIWSPRFVVKSAGGRDVWELRAIREAP